MKYPTRLLWDLARGALDGGTPDQMDRVLEVPPVQLLSVEVPLAQGRLGAFDATTIAPSSLTFHRRIAQLVSSGAASGRLATLSKGLWRCHIVADFFSTFTQAVNAPFTDNTILLEEPGAANNQPLIRFYAITNVPQHVEHTWLWLFTEDSFRLTVQAGATGAGQTLELAASLVAERLA